MILKCFSDMSFKTKNKFSKVTLVTVFSTEYDEPTLNIPCTNSQYKLKIILTTDFFLFYLICLNYLERKKSKYLKTKTFRNKN